MDAWKPIMSVDPALVPPLRELPTTNGEHCTGDGIKLTMDLGATTADIEAVQVHPTGLVNPKDPDAKVLKGKQKKNVND